MSDELTVQKKAFENFTISAYALSMSMIYFSTECEKLTWSLKQLEVLKRINGTSS